MATRATWTDSSDSSSATSTLGIEGPSAAPPADPLAQPLLDYRTGSNPVDFDVYVAHLEYLRRFVGSDTMQSYGAVETAPGADVVAFEDMVAFAKQNMTFSYMHPCCTAAMLAEEKGGVVGPDLRVHGAKGLRIVDMSVFPLEPSSHLSAAAYALGEKVRHHPPLLSSVPD